VGRSTGGKPSAGALAALAHAELFGSLTPAARRAVAAAMTPVDAPAGTVLLRRGEAGDAIYVVVRGRLQVLGEDERTVLAEIAPGQVVGELALLSRRARNANVRVARDSALLRLDVDAFDRLVAEQPDALLSLTRTIVARQELSSSERTAPVRTVAVVAAGRGPEPDLDAFTRRLVASLGRFGAVDVVDATRVDDAAGDGACDAEPGDRKSERVARWLDRVEHDADLTVYVGDSAHPEWTQRCLRQADLVLLVGSAGADPAPTPRERPEASWARRHLVLLHRDGSAMPSGTARWLDPRPDLAAHHHVRLDRPTDVDRLARRITGRSVALVLGGGGPRGFAHLGVVRALEDAGIPVDAFGGASIGAMVAALGALDIGHDERVARMERGLVGTRGLFRPTLPLVSVTSSKRINRMLRDPDYIGDAHVEDTWLPWYAVSTNLSRGLPFVHERGPAWLALRASIALPGILPPVHRDGDLLVDGGVLNNLPVDAMRDRVEGRIVAVDLEPKVDLRYDDPFDPTLSGWRVLAGKLNPLRQAPRVPNLVQIVLRAKQVGGDHAQRSVLAQHEVDLYLQPPIEAFGALNFKAGRDLVDSAYEFASEQLSSGAIDLLR
jgi:predicted acylesterase/phospholipase RssA/CRP-like cAMP-binding protein